MSENLLARETSPYLLQHQNNPVHWRPWGPDAFAEAQKSDKPVLLSIGYAACHWCHVMAHESFEDAETADLMNALFVNVKVDREERPDVDRNYMQALLAFGRRGGWPLTMFLTPIGEPFWGGSYFPPEPRFGQPSFRDVLVQIAKAYREAPDKIRQNADLIASRLQRRMGSDAEIAEPKIDEAAERLLAAMDRENGGLKGAPKFPQASLFEFLWRAGKRLNDKRFDDIVLLSLRKICQGGVYDHLGGGFARYSTDERWLAPHFEKMLYDNAQLLLLLTWAWQETHDDYFKNRVEETIGWLEREMRVEDVYASSLDADSDGGEGRFYVWRLSEIIEALGEDEGSFFSAVYDVSPAGNWEGVNVLNRLDGAKVALPDEERLSRLRDKLLAVRAKRIRPALDDKILTDWNAMAIRALAFAGAVFDKLEWIDRAEAAYRWIRRNMLDGERLVHSARLGKRGAPGLSSDAAQMIAAALALFEATGRESYIEDARAMTHALDRHHWDEAKGYYLSPDDANEPFVRSADAQDEAVPSPNGVMAANLARLGLATGESDWLKRANRLFQIFGGDAMASPFEHFSLLNAFDLAQDAVQMVVLEQSSRPSELTRAALERFNPNLIMIRATSTHAFAPEHPAYGRSAVAGKATAYVCRQSACSLPVVSANELDAALASTRIR